MQIPAFTKARCAGFLYLLLAVLGAFSVLYVPSETIVWDSAEITHQTITSHLTLFKLGIVAGLFHQVLFLILAVLLYSLLERHGRDAALLLLVFVVAGAPIYFLNVMEKWTVADRLGGEGMLADQLMMHLARYRAGMQLSKIFWGLWLLPFGYLILKSALIPRVLGVLLVAGGIGYVANIVAPFLWTGYHATHIGAPLAVASVFGEMGACLWLLAFGCRKVKL